MSFLFIKSVNIGFIKRFFLFLFIILLAVLIVVFTFVNRFSFKEDENTFQRYVIFFYKKKNVVYKIPIDNIKLMTSHECDVDNLKLFPREYQEEQIKLIALDIMMEQTDRYGENMGEIVRGNSLKLAPLIDFSESFNRRLNPSFFYSNSYVCLPKDIKNIDKFLNDFPEA